MTNEYSTIKARLTRDYSTLWFEYEKGRTGTYTDRVVDGKVLFLFDGYEEAKLRNKKLWLEEGEGHNIVPWHAEIPIDLLERIT